ncbi:Rv3212 family protein [Mycolicibacter minnesotensis]
MVRPERRTPGDLVAATAIAVLIAVVGVAIWWTSDARATDIRPASDSATNPPSAAMVPAALSQLWTASSPVTWAPVLVSGTVITGDGPRMSGRDPLTGEERWSYARGVDLCAVSWIYRYAVAVYPDSRGCGQVSAIVAATGMRGPARTSYADRTVKVTSEGNAVLSAGSSRLELWRSDLVRVMSYGEIDARVKPSARGIGQGCTLVSAAAATSAVSVLEACEGRSDLQLTLLRASKEEDEPETQHIPERGVAADSGARVLAVTDSDAGTNTAVYLPSPQPRIEVVDQTGTTIAKTLLPGPPSAASAALPVSRPSGLICWWTGDAVMVFDSGTLTHRFTVTGSGPAVPLGPAVQMGDRLLIPVTGGVGVYDRSTGASERVIPVSRPPGVTTVFPAVSGPTVLEQRGDTVVALG